MQTWKQMSRYFLFSNKHWYSCLFFPVSDILFKWNKHESSYSVSLSWLRLSLLTGIAGTSTMVQNSLIVRHLIINFHYGSKLLNSETSYHSLSHEIGSEWAVQANERTSERTSKWLSAYASIHGCSEHQWLPFPSVSALLSLHNPSFIAH